jgi:uncharacterized membrane protein YbhN (UPF0104 family)
LVVWLVGWNDVVTASDGRIVRGRAIEVGNTHALVRTDAGEERVAIDSADRVRRGLGGAFAHLARSPGTALLGTTTLLVSIFLQVLRWNVLLRGAGLGLPLRTVVRLGWIGHFFNQVLPAGQVGGDIVKAWMAARRFPDRKNAAVVSVLADRGIGLSVLFFGAAAAVWFAPPGSRLALARSIALGLFALCALFLTLLLMPRLRARLRLVSLLERLPFGRTWVATAESVDLYGRRPRVVAAALGVGVVVHAFFLGSFVLFGRALGIEMGVLAVLVAIPVALVAGSLPGLPAGWGVGDMAFYFFLPAAGVPAGSAVALSFTFRAVLMLLSLPGGLLVAGRRVTVPPPAS